MSSQVHEKQAGRKPNLEHPPKIQEMPGEVEAEVTRDAFRSAAPGNVAARLNLARLDTATRAQVLARWQLERGNQQVQRLVAPRGKPEAPVAAEPNAVAQTGLALQPGPPSVQRAEAAAQPKELSWWERAKKAMFMGALAAAGVDQNQVMVLMNRAGSAIAEIFRHPGRFINTIIKAIGKGFTQFKDNIGKHLEAGLMAWLFGTMEKAGVQLPKEFSLKAIMTMVLQILGITAENVKSKISGVIGDKNMRAVESVWDVLSQAMKGGIGGLWEMLKEYVGDLKQLVIDQIKSWLITQIIQSAILFVLSMFNPVSGLIRIIKTIYNVVKFLIERASQIKALFQAIAGSVVELAMGNMQAAANNVELALARLIPIAIGFLASLLNIGGIADKVKSIIRGIQGRIDKALNLVIGKVAQGLKKIGVTKLLDKAASGVEWAKGKAQKGVEYVKGQAEKGVSWAKGKAKAGVQAVKGAVQRGGAWMWEKLHAKFVVRGEEHRVWFEAVGGKPQLMIASSKSTFNHFMRQMREKTEALSPSERQRLAPLLDQADVMGELVRVQAAREAVEYARNMGNISASRHQSAEQAIRTQLDSLLVVLRTILGVSDWREKLPGRWTWFNGDCLNAEGEYVFDQIVASGPTFKIIRGAHRALKGLNGRAPDFTSRAGRIVAGMAERLSDEVGLNIARLPEEEYAFRFNVNERGQWTGKKLNEEQVGEYGEAHLRHGPPGALGRLRYAYLHPSAHPSANPDKMRNYYVNVIHEAGTRALIKGFAEYTRRPQDLGKPQSLLLKLYIKRDNRLGYQISHHAENKYWFDFRV